MCAVMEIPFAKEEGKDFNLHCSLLRRKHESLNLGLDKGLNRRFQVESFKIESLQLILLAMNLGDWMLFIVIGNLSSSAHTSCPPNISLFCDKSTTFKYQSLQFGISTAPRTFTKVLLPEMAFLREKGLSPSGQHPSSQQPGISHCSYVIGKY